MQSENLKVWSERFSAAMLAMGTPRFGGLLDEAIGALAPFDISCVFLYPDGRPPLFLYDGLRGTGSDIALQNYLKGTYLLDAVYYACTKRIDGGLYRISELAPDAFFVGDYFNSWDVHPCISMDSGSLAEEIVFVVPFPDGSTAAYSVMRSNGSEPFSETEIEDLRLVEPVVRAALISQWHAAEPTGSENARPWSARGKAMEHGFESFAADILSERERMVVQLVLRGHSSGSIAQHLDIAEGTVKNHRKSIYAKLGLSSQAELFSMFVRHVCGSEADITAQDALERRGHSPLSTASWGNERHR